MRENETSEGLVFFFMGRAGLNLGILFLGSIKVGRFRWTNGFGLTLSPLLHPSNCGFFSSPERGWGGDGFYSPHHVLALPNVHINII